MGRKMTLPVMRQDFRADFDEINPFNHDPFCFVKFADGEQGLLEGRPDLGVFKQFEQFSTLTAKPRWIALLHQSLNYSAPGYYVGLSCPCCDPHGHDWYLRRVGSPRQRVTFGNLWVNGNYDRFRNRERDEQWLERCCLVGSYGSIDEDHPRYLKIPQNMLELDVDLPETLYRINALGGDNSPILIAAGPAANVLGYLLWNTGDRRRSIIDIGSTLDPVLHGVPTRGYHDPAHPNRGRSCHWSSPCSADQNAAFAP